MTEMSRAVIRKSFTAPLTLAAAALSGCATTGIAPADRQVAVPEATGCANDAAVLDGDFATGALGGCTATGPASFSLTIAPEDSPPINCSAWYAFRATPIRPATLTVDLTYEACGHRYWPKISTDGQLWTSIPEDAIVIAGKGAERTAQLTLQLGNKPLFIAGQEILAPAEYAEWLAGLARRPSASLSTIGQSAENRDIQLLTIAGNEGDQRETILLVGRQHPPEVSGALAMFPFVETLLENSPLADTYRARFETLVVPMLNPDGVVHGHWRHNTGGVDLNRDWGPFTQPETQLVKNLMDDVAADPQRELRLMLDFHSTHDDVFYTIPDNLPTQPELFTKRWLDTYQARMPGYAVNRIARHEVGRPISKAYVYDTYSIPGVTFEIGDETDRAQIRRIGREAAIAMMETLLERDAP